MTADEIRQEHPECSDIGKDLFYMLREVAAQLAELNQNLKDAAKRVDDRSLFGQVFGK